MKELASPDTLLLVSVKRKIESWKQKALMMDQALLNVSLDKHRVVVASGYSSIGLPGISEALEQRD